MGGKGKMCSLLTQVMFSSLLVFFFSRTFVAGLSENIIAALCINKTLITLKLARNGLRKFYFSKLFYPKCLDWTLYTIAGIQSNIWGFQIRFLPLS